ncbi:MAG: MFS transporter, partial [Chloroflexota bacterium]
MQIIRNRLFMAASIGHLVLDIFNSAGPVIVAFLSVELGLNNTMIAVAIGTYQFAGSLSQPIFGWLADRYGGRWLMGLSVIWTVGFLVASIFAAQTGLFWPFLVLYVLAALGSGAFHPVGTKFAALTATKRAATFTALFFLFGQFGLATGPALTGFMLDTIGLIGFPLMALCAIPFLLFVLSTRVPGEGKEQSQPEITSSQPAPNSTPEAPLEMPWGSLGILC